MRAPLLVIAAAVALYLPTARHGFVQDDRAIVESNPAAHSVRAALRAVGDPYWPRPSQAGLWRPLTILSFAVDWSSSGGRAAWLHLSNAVWHAIASVLAFVILARWLARPAALAGGLVFAAHPVHVEAVAGLVGRAELVAAVLMLGAVVALRRGHWKTVVGLSVGAMLAKEHGVVIGVALLVYYWLDTDVPRAPPRLWVALGTATAVYLALWHAIGGAGAGDVAAPFIGASTGQRLAIALPAVARAAHLLLWPQNLSVDYGPQVLPVPDAVTPGAIAGALVVAGAAALVWMCRRRAPAIAWPAALTALAYLPTSNLLFPSGIVLAERNLYLAALLPAAAIAWLVSRARRDGSRLVPTALAVVVVAALAARSVDRLPAWRDNRALLLTLLAEHPESQWGHASAAAVQAGMGDRRGAAASYARAVALYDRNPHVLGAYALFALGGGDTGTAAALAARARSILPGQAAALEVQRRLRGSGGGAGNAQTPDDSLRVGAGAGQHGYPFVSQ